MKLVVSNLPSGETSNPFPIADDGYLYVLSFGQSNMVGVYPKSRTEPKAGDHTNPTMVYVPDNLGDWQLATFGENCTIYLTFCRDLSEKYNIPIRLINSAIGGNPIESWYLGGLGYDQLDSSYRTFPFFGNPDLIRPAGLLIMHHGESGGSVNGNTYEDSFFLVKQGFESKGWLLPDTAFICGGLGDRDSYIGKNQNLKDIVANDPEKYRYARPDGLERGDDVHYLGDALQFMGERYLLRYEDVLFDSFHPIDDTAPTTPIMTVTNILSDRFTLSWTASTPKVGLSIVSYRIHGYNGYIEKYEVNGSTLSTTVYFTTELENFESSNWAVGGAEYFNVLAEDNQGNFSWQLDSQQVTVTPI